MVEEEALGVDAAAVGSAGAVAAADLAAGVEAAAMAVEAMDLATARVAVGREGGEVVMAREERACPRW